MFGDPNIHNLDECERLLNGHWLPVSRKMISKFEQAQSLPILSHDGD
jgi:hypothetical protein